MAVKTFRNLYPQVSAYENLHEAWRRAARGKRRTAQVGKFEFRLIDELLKLEAGRLPAPISCLRGGSWNNDRRNARVSYRNHNHPDNFNNNSMGLMPSAGRAAARPEALGGHSAKYR